MDPLDRDYLEWRAQQIKLGNIPKPPVPLYDPSKKEVPFLSETQRKRYGPLPELEEEFRQISSKKFSSKDTRRFLDLEGEIRRLKVQEEDISWSLGQQQADDDFIRQSYKGTKQTAQEVAEGPLKPTKGFRRFLTKRNALIAGGVATAALLLMPKQEHNTIEGLHPGSQGIGTMVLRSHSAFGSGAVTSKLLGMFNVYKQAPLGVRNMKMLESLRSYEGTGVTDTYNIYSSYESVQEKSAKQYLSGFMRHKGTKFPGMPDIGMSANIRESHTEFKAKFASRWDPMRKLANELFQPTAGKSAFKQMTSSPEFKGAIREAMKSEGKVLGKGAMGEVKSYTAQLAMRGKTHEFEFAAKTALSAEEMAKTPGLGVLPKPSLERIARSNRRAITREAQALEELGSMRTPSLYGRISEDTILMEKFKNAKEIAKDTDGTITLKEQEALEGFMKTAHKKGYTHTDLHGGNILRVLDDQGKSQAAIIDWGLTNRFAKDQGIGGQSSHVWEQVSDIVNEEAQKTLGTTVSLKQYSQMADIKRLQAHTIKDSPLPHHMGINELIRSSEIKSNLSAKTESIIKSEELLREASRLVLDRSKESGYTGQQLVAAAGTAVARPRGRVAEMAGTAVVGHRRVKVAAATANISPPVGNLVAKTNPGKPLNRLKRKREMAFADTIVGDPVVSDRVQLADHFARTEMANTNTARILKRNRKFQRTSRESVGIGLRTAHRAGKGHVNYGSTRV